MVWKSTPIFCISHNNHPQTLLKLDSVQDIIAGLERLLREVLLSSYTSEENYQCMLPILKHLLRGK